jgi:Na+/phosphate symporter
MTDAPDIDLLVTVADNPDQMTLPAAKEVRTARSLRSAWKRVPWTKLGLFGVSIFLFVLAITLMKEGASSLVPFVRNQFAASNPANSLGFGWLFAYVTMSGSPVAAAALTFFDGGAISELGAFMMIIGSRLGGSFIVLVIGFIYVLRGRNLINSLDMGLLSLTVTGTTYVVALVISIGFLYTGILDQISFQSGALLSGVTDLIFTPIVVFFLTFFPHWALFLVGLVTIVISFSLFDKCLPQMTLKESQLGQMSRLVYRPWVMFALGAAITLISMSVSVSLALLVPLSNRGFVRRENVIPYIMGANISTFIDTLFVAVLLNNPAAFTLVLVSMVSITIVSIIILATVYHRYEHQMLAFIAWVMRDKRNLAFFVAIILVIPVILILV